MKIGAYQFAVTGSIDENMNAIRSAIALAKNQSVRLLVFPECALTGYPPEKIESSEAVDIRRAEECIQELRNLATGCGMFLIVGSVTRRGDRFFNSAVLIRPGKDTQDVYDKRALWGWDRDNFSEGHDGGVWEVDGYRFGVRICYEVRFPEYFRELYRAKVDFAVVIFCDVSDADDVNRYELIRAHLRTRASETVCPVLSVNDIAPFQTAPTAVFDNCGDPVTELPRNREGLLVYEFQRSELSFSARGRATVSDRLTKMA